MSAAERRGGVVGGAHRVGVLGSLAGATCGPRSNFSSLIEKPPGTREGAQREFGGGHLGSCRPARPWVPRPALSKAACWLRSLMTRGKVVTSSSYGGGWNSTSRGARLLSGGSGAVRRLGQEEAGVILRIQGCLSFGLGEGCMRQFPLTRLILAGCSGFPRLFRLYFFFPQQSAPLSTCGGPFLSLSIHVCVNFANPLNFLATQNAGGNLGHAVSQLCVSADYSSSQFGFPHNSE